MRKHMNAVIGVLAALAVAGGAGAAWAQSTWTQSRAPQRDRVINVPPGATVIIMPGGLSPSAWPGVGFGARLPFPAMPDANANAFLRHVDQMMANAQREFAIMSASVPKWSMPIWGGSDRSIEAAMRQTLNGASQMSDMVVTSFSDGQHTWTRRIVYPGDGAAPKIQVSTDGGRWIPAQIPAASGPQHWTGPHTVEAGYRAPPMARPLLLARAGD